LKRIVFLILFSLVFTGVTFAELETAVEIMGLTSATRDAAGNPAFGLLAKGDLTFTAINNSNVKAVAELLGYWSGSLVTSPADLLKRLYVKVDFGGLTALVGKGRVTWGEGFVFNAGDVVFGSLQPVSVTDLTQSQLRDQTDWLADLTLALGDFTYLEAIFLPYSPLTSGISFTDVYHLRGGGRFVTNLGGLKLETGYLFKADEAAHHPYLSLQGSLFFDFYLSSSLKIPAAGYTDDKLKQGLALSAGLFRLFQLEDGSSVTVRLEASCYPFGLWQAAAPSSGVPSGLLLYPEFSWSPDDVLSLQLRAFINPIDGSGLAFTGCSLQLYQGFTLVGYAWVMWGDGRDPNFGFGRQGDLGISIGLDFLY
jgi:hypothetical protein